MEKSKTNDVIMHLIKYGTITPKEAVNKYNLYRLGSVIFELRKRGMVINTEKVPFTSKYGTKSSYAKYHLISTGD